MANWRKMNEIKVGWYIQINIFSSENEFFTFQKT